MVLYCTFSLQDGKNVSSKWEEDQRDKLLMPVAEAIQGIIEKKDNQNQGPVGDTHVDTIAKAKGYKPQCKIKDSDASSALDRARTDSCKQQIADTYCAHQKGKLYPPTLPRYCPLKGKFCFLFSLPPD